MAKMFYTMDETKVALAKNEEEIKQLAREGRLREFRDGPRLMFKADQVEQLKAELGGGPEPISLAPAADSGAPIGLVDSKSGTGSGLGIALSDSATGKSPTKEDTAFADIGLSGSLGGSVTGIPSPRDSGGSSAGTRGGISVIDADDARRADPSAQTSVSAASRDQINLEGAGSGSGLLDLTRESDDTSLGAVFDELQPSGARRGAATPTAAMETQAGEDLGMAAMDRGARAQLTAPIYVERPDATTAALGFASLAAAAIVFFCGFILIAAVMGYRPAILDDLRASTNGLMYFLVAVGVTLIFGIAGFFVGRTAK